MLTSTNTDTCYKPSPIARTLLKVSQRAPELAARIHIEPQNMSELSALLSLLTKACRTVEQEYAKTSKPLPSLEDIDPHPLDDQLYPLELRESVRIIEAATAQLCALVGRPNHVIANVSVINLSKIMLTKLEMHKRK
jgi:hypothetical protein